MAEPLLPAYERWRKCTGRKLEVFEMSVSRKIVNSRTFSHPAFLLQAVWRPGGTEKLWKDSSHSTVYFPVERFVYFVCQRASHDP